MDLKLKKALTAWNVIYNVYRHGQAVLFYLTFEYTMYILKLNGGYYAGSSTEMGKQFRF